MHVNSRHLTYACVYTVGTVRAVAVVITSIQVHVCSKCVGKEKTPNLQTKPHKVTKCPFEDISDHCPIILFQLATVTSLDILIIAVFPLFPSLFL